MNGLRVYVCVFMPPRALLHLLTGHWMLLTVGEHEALMMLDTKHPLMEGGCGQTFDWTVAKECQDARPMFVAGGLGPDNVAE